MNNTKWNEIFKRFYHNQLKGYYDRHPTDEIFPPLYEALYHEAWHTLNSVDYAGDIPYSVQFKGRSSPSHDDWATFGSQYPFYKDIVWLKIHLTPQNRQFVLRTLHEIHVPGEELDDCVYVYGNRTDVDYL